MSGCCECDCSGVILRNEVCSSTIPPQYPYNVPYTGREQPLKTNWLVSQSDPDAPFTTNPNWPLNQGANQSEILNNTKAKNIFVSINNLKDQGAAFGRNAPVFKSEQEKIAYLQAQYSQAYYLPKKGINTLYS